MSEPNVKEQVADIEEQYRDNLITEQEYHIALDRVRRNHTEWIKRNE